MTSEREPDGKAKGRLSALVNKAKALLGHGSPNAPTHVEAPAPGKDRPRPRESQYANETIQLAVPPDYSQPIWIVDTSRPRVPEAHLRLATPADLKSLHTPAMLEKWHIRRAQAIAAIRQAASDPALGAQALNDLTQMTHKLAGSAGMFGEDELGSRAAALERGLKAKVNPDVRHQLARELLEIA